MFKHDTTGNSFYRTSDVAKAAETNLFQPPWASTRLCEWLPLCRPVHHINAPRLMLDEGIEAIVLIGSKKDT